jgi:hypothetical protein
MDRKVSLRVLEWAGLALWLGACNSSHSPAPTPGAAGHERQGLAFTAECAAGSAAGASWVCTAPASVTCAEAADLPPIQVQAPSGATCSTANLRVSEQVQAGSSTRTITVRDASGNALCSSTVTVNDSLPPVLETRTVSLWPPNHKFHEITVADCVSAVDACDGSLRGTFLWASSDEPIDDIGDGHHAPDIGVSADGTKVCVRSERQGPKDGRVYKLGVRVVDSSGNAVEGTCAVIVDHDKRGVVGADSGEKYRLTFTGGAGVSADCIGEPDEPPPPPPPGDTPDAGTTTPDAGETPDAGDDAPDADGPA